MKSTIGSFERLGLAPKNSLGLRHSASPCMNGLTSKRQHLIHYRRSYVSIRCDIGATLSKKKLSSRKDKVPPLPNPHEYQQTLLRSFTIGGIGLHTGEKVVVCIRPAYAGEGRYFVRVPPGTNSDECILSSPQPISQDQLDIRSGADDGLDDEARTQLFFEYIQAQNSGFDGEFGDFIRQEVGDPTDTYFIDRDSFGPPEDPHPLSPSDLYLPATLSASSSFHNVSTRLSNADFEVVTVEPLLAALEACGVDNARIEIEGGNELPVIDGSGQGWCLEIQKAGLREAFSSSSPPPSAVPISIENEEISASDGNGNTTTTLYQSRTAPAPQEFFTVQEGESFISFYPGGVPRITAGVDYFDVAIIGRPWFTWTPEDSTLEDSYMNHYRWQVAPARLILPSFDAAMEMFDNGLLQAGPDNVCLIANNTAWTDPLMERFTMDEAARHAVATLMGNMALGAAPGGRGLPQGHVIAYRASNELQLKFVKALHIKSQEWAYEEVSQ